MSDMNYTSPPLPPVQPPKKDNSILILAVALIAIAVIAVVTFITRTSGNDTGSNVAPTPEPVITAAPINKYDAYYEHVLNESGRANSMSKSDVIRLGDLVCEAFDEGYSAGNVVDVMAKASSDSSDVELAAAALWGAATYLCPEYEPMMKSYLNN